MSIQEIQVEHFAQLFHYYHQALANDSENTPIPTRDAWADVSSSEKDRTIAAARLALLDLTPAERPSRPYFAKPGEAEWGC